jgi:23S rRNA (cytosine1962-C5)-methyltransferase
MALQGAAVTHVDAMKQAVDWGRTNAKLSGLEDRPIRWIVEDARKYVARELKRQSRYELVVLDPPSYGHGRKGEAWEIHRDLVPLMKDCWGLLSEDPIGVVLTSHSLNISAKELRMELEMDDRDGYFPVFFGGLFGSSVRMRGRDSVLQETGVESRCPAMPEVPVH